MITLLKRLNIIIALILLFLALGIIKFKNNLSYKNFPSKKINRSNYFRELANILISVTPFALGEITLKDFESFISGSI